MLTKTNYILYRECPKNAWFKIHKPDLYYASELSEFEKAIIQTGNEVELVARKLFPEGVLIKGRGADAETATQNYINDKKPVLFQPFFCKDGLVAALDVLEFDPVNNAYAIYEIKGTNSVKKHSHYHDVAFQVNLLESCGLKVNKSYLIHLDPDYLRLGELDIRKLFKIEDISEKVEAIRKDVSDEAKEAVDYLSSASEPEGFCCCIYKGRSDHCPTFEFSNPHLPDYSVHDIARIGNSPAKLRELIDRNIFHIKDVPADFELSDGQKSQIEAYIYDKVLIQKEKIAEELNSLVFPLYFLDYETFPCAIPRFDGYSPYQQIPFQYSLHVLSSADGELKHFEFLNTDSKDPSRDFAESLRQHVGNAGSIIVWHKSFECGRNNEIAERIQELKSFMDCINSRTYDLEEIFKKQYHVHKDFRGGTSIKRILPVIVPELKYDDLEIREGGNASDAWNKIVGGFLNNEEKEKAIADLKAYCELDSYAMYAIWRALRRLRS